MNPFFGFLFSYSPHVSFVGLLPAEKAGRVSGEEKRLFSTCAFFPLWSF